MYKKDRFDLVDPRIIKLRERKKNLRCTICPPNQGENTKRKNQYQKRHKSWKLLRKTQRNEGLDK